MDEILVKHGVRHDQSMAYQQCNIILHIICQTIGGEYFPLSLKKEKRVEIKRIIFSGHGVHFSKCNNCNINRD